MSLAGRVRVNAIAPGWIDTRDSAQTEADRLQHPVGRVGTPEDIVNATLFLCSEESGFITGQVLTVDGGMLKKLSDEKINTILETGIAEFAQNGPDRANINVIARKSGVSVGVIYKYYTNKDDFFEACLRHVRVGEAVHAPLVSLGGADYLLSFEALEAARAAAFLKIGGVAIVNTQRISPMLACGNQLLADKGVGGFHSKHAFGHG